MQAKATFQVFRQLMLMRNLTGDRGMTMIELLVVIMIISLLSALALPSVLIFSNRARESEARTYVSTLNKSQQAYYMQFGVFGTMGELGVGIPTSTNNYAYASTPDILAGSPIANTVATPTGSMRGFAGRVWLGPVAGSVTSFSITCEGSMGAVPVIVGTNCP